MLKIVSRRSHPDYISFCQKVVVEFIKKLGIFLEVPFWGKGKEE